MALTYQEWKKKNAGTPVTQSIYDRAIAKYGKMPNSHRSPDGSYFWNSQVANDLGLPSGTHVSTASSAPRGTRNLSVYAPTDIAQAVQNSGLPLSSGLTELYNRGGVYDAFSGASPEPTPTPSRPVPRRGRGSGTIEAPGAVTPAADAPSATTSMAPVPQAAQPSQSGPYPTPPTTPPADLSFPNSPFGTGSDQVSNFVDWWRGNGARMEGDLGSVYNMPQPVQYQGQAGNELLFPGTVGKGFDTNPALLAERVQTHQLTNGLQPYGALSPLLPPHLVGRSGYGGSDILGGQFGPGQVAASDPSSGGVLNAGGLDFFNSQTPSGPYAGADLGGGNFSLGDNNGSFNPPPYLSNPGQGGVPGTGNPFPPLGGGGAGGGTGGGGTGGGGGGGGTGNNPFPPLTPGGTAPPPAAGGPVSPTGPGGGTLPQAGAAPGATSSADAWLAQLGPDLGYLEDFARDGRPVNALPAWQAMIDAQERGIDRRFADLEHAFGASGMRFSSPFGQAATDFQTQAAKDQNALLGQMNLAASEAGMGRQFGAASQLGGLAGQGIGQLSNQDFQSAMRQFEFAQQLANQQYQGSLLGAQGLQGASLGAAGQLYGPETQAGFAETQRQLQLLGLGLDQAGTLSDLWQQNLGTGVGLGTTQYGLEQDQIDRIFNEWLRTRNYNNPQVPYIEGLATGYPPQYFPQYRQNPIWGLAGSIAGAATGGLLGGN